MDSAESASSTVKYLEKCQDKLFERFFVECDNGLYHKAGEVISLLQRLDVI